jgi:autotransporter translocation and assembly factor TamB
MKRKLAISLTSILLFVLICTTFTYFLFTTSTGLNQAFQLIQKFAPGKLAVKKLEGCLTGPITFTELTYQDPDVDIIINKLQLDWTLQHLLQGQLVIKHIAIDQPKILIKPSNTDSDIDWRSFLKHIRVDTLFIKQGLIQYRNNLLKIQGILDQQWHLNWQLIIPNFKNLSPNLQGNLDLQGKINGAHDTPLILLPLNNQTLVGETWAIRHLQGLITFTPTQVSAKLNNLQIDLPNFKNLTGQFNVDIHLHDILTNPQFNGVISLHHARGELPNLGLLLRNINIQAILDNTSIKWLGNLKSGAGNLALTGTTHLKQKYLTTLLNLQGKNLTVSDLKNYKITATPNLQIKVDTQRLDVNGDIFLPQARSKAWTISSTV